MLADVLRGYATATHERAVESGTADELVRDLEVFASALVSSDQLRRVLVDPTVSPVARRSVVAELLEGKATPEATALIGFAVRVTPAAELPVVITDLTAIGSGSGFDEAPAGIEASRERLRGYAERVLEELGSTDEVDEMEDTFFRLARVLEHHLELRSVLVNQTAPLAGRLAVVHDLLAGKASEPTIRVVSYVLRAGRVRNLVGALDSLVALCAAERGRRVAEVRSAVDLDEAERNRLAAALRRLTGREVEVRVLIDESVIGGVLISVGDLVIDGTVRLRVERLRDALAESA